MQVANVQANGLREVVELTTDQGSLFGGNAIPWERNPGIEAFPSILQYRSTVLGDVIVDPQGQAYRVEENHFRRITAGKEVQTALSELFREWRADEAAAKREGAHRVSLGELLADQAPPPPAPGKERDRGIER